MKDTAKKSIILMRFSLVYSIARNEDTTMQGEQIYMSMADTVDRCDATAFFVLQSMYPGTIYIRASNTLKNAILNVTIDRPFLILFNQISMIIPHLFYY